MKQKLPSTCRAPRTLDFYDPGTNSLTGILPYNSRIHLGFDPKLSITLLLACIFSLVLGLNTLQAQIGNAPPNELSPWTTDTYSDLVVNIVDDVSSTIPVCLGGVNNEERIIDDNLGEPGTITFGAALLGCNATLSVADPVNDYPAGTWAGFRVGTGGLLGLNVGLEITITTYMDGVNPVQSQTFDAGLISASLLSDNIADVGFITTGDFNEIRITYQTLVGVAQLAEIYHASIVSFEEGPALACNTTTSMMRPAYPMSISEDNTDLGSILAINGSSASNNVIDSDPNNFATLDFTLGSGSLSVKDEVTDYDAETFAGFDIESTSLLSVGLLDAITITTYLDGIEQETADGTSGGILALNTSILNSGNERSQIGFITSQPFDEVQITGSAVALGSMNVYGLSLKEFCPADPSVLACNTPVMATEPDFPLLINGVNTGVSGIGVGDVTNINAVIDADDTNFATIDLALGVLGTASLSVQNPLDTYPANTYTGFDLETGGILSLDLLNNVTLTTYLEGVEQESIDGSSEALLAVNSGLLFGDPGRYQIGFVASTPFDEVQISMEQIADVDLGVTNIYGVILQTLCESPITCDITPLSNPGQPVIINSAATGASGVGGVGTSLENVQNVISEDITDFATVSLGVGVGESVSISVLNPIGEFPSGSQAGFLVRDVNDFLEVGLLDQITVSTYLDGTQVDSFSGGGLLLLQALGLINLDLINEPGSEDFSFIGVTTTGDYDEVRLEIGAVVTALNEMEVYGAYVNPRTIEGLDNNPTIAITSIGEDNIINATESEGSVIIEGTTGGDAAEGDAVVVTVNGVNYNTTVQSGGTFTVDVPGSGLEADASLTVTAVITHVGGDCTSTAETSLAYTLDLDAPTVPTVEELITNDTTPELTGTADSVDELTIEVNGITYSEVGGDVIDNGDDTWTLQIPDGNEIPEGVYDVVATATDAAGNTAVDVTVDELTIDTTDPTTPTVDELVTNDTTPELTGTADSVDELTIEVNGITYSEVGGDVIDNGDDTWTLQIPDGNEIPEGIYDVVATATDAAGNTATDGTVDELTIDTTDPTTPTVDELITNDTTPELTGTADSEDALTVEVNGVTYVESDGYLTDNGDGTWVLQIPVGNEIPEGVYDVVAVATDIAGNTASDTSLDELTIDTTNPTVPTVDEQITTDTTPEITGTADSEDELTIEVNGITYTEGDGNLIDNGDDTWLLQIPDGNELPDGIYDVVATATDIAGNASSDDTIDELRIDTTAPTVPTVNEHITNSNTPLLTGTADSIDELTVAVNGVTYTEGDGSLTDNADDTWSLQIPDGNEIPDGVYDVVATATDLAGNISTDTTVDELTIDQNAVTTPTVDKLVTNNRTPEITGTADSENDLTVAVDGVTYTEGDGNLIDNGDDTWTLQVPSGNEIADGVYDVVATATDGSGNTSSDTTTDELTIDTVGPTIPTVNPVVTNDTTPEITGTADSIDALTVAVNGVTYTEGDGSLFDHGDDTWFLRVPIGNEIPDGIYDVVATATDMAGNNSIDATVDELTIDTVAPTPPTVEAQVTNNQTPEITGTASSIDELSVAVHGVVYAEGDGNLTDNGNDTWTLQIPAGNPIPEGIYNVVATATDAVGNTSNDTTTDELTIDLTAPTVPTVNQHTTSNHTPLLSGTADSVDDLTVEVNGVTYTEGDGSLTDNGDGTWALQIPVGNEIPDGVYDVVATATDVAGNTSNDATVNELTIDPAALTTPTVDKVISNSSTPEITGTADSADDLTVEVDQVTYAEGDGNLTDHGDNRWTLQVPDGNEIPDGIYDVVATVTDGGGSSSTDVTTDELTIDTVAPTAPTVDVLVTNSPTPEITGTADSVDELTVGVNGVVYTEGNGELTDNGNNTWTLKVPLGNEIPDGVYDVTATAMDTAGNVSTDDTVDELTVNSASPNTPTVNTIATPDPTPHITGTADSEDDLTVEVNGVVYTEGDGNLTDNGDNTWMLQVPDGNEIPDGVYDVIVTVIDQFGGTANDTTTDELTVNSASPNTPTVNPIATPDPTPQITGTADSEDDLTVEVNGVVYTEGDGNLTDNGNNTWTLQVPDGNEIPVGTYDVVVTVTNDTGNTSTDTTTDELTIDSSAPTTPTVDPIATPDPTPQITGTADSEDDLTVEVDGVVYTEGDGNLVDNGDGTWTLQVPDGNEIPIGTYDVIVKVTDDSGNTSTDATTDELTIETPPVSDISITKVADQLNPLVGDLIKFTVTVSNGGATEFSELLIDEVITSGFTYQRHTASIGNYQPTVGQWKLEELAANQTATLEIWVEVNPTGNHTNIASIRSSVPQDDTSNNSDEVTIELNCLQVFNEFTPNFDGYNDYFRIECIEQYPNSVLKIFNRYGNKVYEVVGYQNDWTGIANVNGAVNRGKELPAGVYYYSLVVREIGVDKSGWLYIAK
ncbi:repeat domain-containing protein [Galbibacter marinus]|uniref:Repeat domain-containing protein n=2 Tax=Galbibacter marinus TaxID=555500 RepID=K2Q0T5_9FLAO|nr:repeat domain-containing protein [Galbibacter marinus]